MEDDELGICEEEEGIEATELLLTELIVGDVDDVKLDVRGEECEELVVSELNV